MRKVQWIAVAIAMSAATAWAQTSEVVPRGKARADGTFSVPQGRVNLETPRAEVKAQARTNRDADRWRYRYHNNHWWYWTPGNKWVIYYNKGWLPYDTATYGTYYPGWRNSYYDGRGRYSTGYRGNYRPGYDYGPGYGRGYGPGYSPGYGRGYYNNNRGANIGAGIGGAIDGGRGAAAGAAIGGAIDDD